MEAAMALAGQKKARGTRTNQKISVGLRIESEAPSFSLLGLA